MDEFYNEWVADLVILLVKKEVSDRLMYQDDYIRNDFYDMYTKYDIRDGKQLIHTDRSLSERYGLFDASIDYDSGVPEHSFDA